MSYFDASHHDLLVAHCGDARCLNGTSIETVDSEGSVGYFPSMALDANGFPVVSYLGKEKNGTPKVLYCGDAKCKSGNTIRTLDSGIGGYARTTAYTSCLGSGFQWLALSELL